MWLITSCILAPSAVLAAADEIPPLRPPHPELHASFLQQHGWLVVVVTTVVLGAIVLGLKRIRRAGPVVVVPPEVRARSALEALRGHSEDSALVAEVSRILRRYLLAAFSLPPDELTTPELQKALQTHSQTSPDLAAAIISFLRHCDEWKFAPVPSAPPSGVAASALELVEKTEARRKQATQTVR